MRFTSVTVAALLVADGNVSAFSVRPPMALASARQQQQPKSRLSPLHFTEISGGMEELEELTKGDKSALSKQVRKSPSLWKMAGYATIPVSAALGFGLVPSRRLAAHAAGAIVTGVAGAVGKSRLDAITESAALPALAQTLLDNGLDDPTTTAEEVQKIKVVYGIDDGDFEAICADVYSRYLLGMAKYNPTAKTSELKELENLKAALSLSNLQVGEAHAAASSEWYRTTCLFTPEEDLEDPEHPDRQAMDKFLFLTERALRQGGETDEAFKFEMTRVAKAMNLKVETAMERVAEVAEPFYQRALKSTRSKLGSNQVSEAMLERARKTLGISEATAFDMHVACFNEEVRALLGLAAEQDEEAGASEAIFPEGAKDRLDQLAEVLGLSEQDASYEVTVEVTPLYQATALAAMKAVLAGTKTADQAWEEMDRRREELVLTLSDSKALISSMVMQALGGPLEETNKFAKVNNEAAVYDNILEALEAKQALLAILSKSGWDDFENFDKTFCDPWDRHSANGFLRSDERIKIYKIFLTRSVRKAEKGRLTDEMYDRIMQVKGLLGISDDQAEVEARGAFGPELQKACYRALTEIISDYTPELATNMLKEVDSVMENFRLSEDFLREQGASCYSKAASQISAKSPAGIPTEEMREALESLRTIYTLDIEDTYPAHMEYFGSVYKKSILESMGSTGVIRPEYRDALNNLRDRLGVRQEDTNTLFLEAVEEKMIPMVEWINSEMERTMLTQEQLAQRRGKDMGQDVFQSGRSADGVLGLGADVNIMGDIMNLVDFYTENGIAEEKELGTKDVDGEEVPVIETAYPITAIGSGALDQEMAEYLYRQFVVGAFSTQGPQATRYEKSRATFGGILGLTSEKMEEVNDNIGNTVYDNFVSRTMATKGALDQQDMMFLANIQGKLGLTPEQGEKMLLEAQKKVLSEEINILMDTPTPEGLKAFREKCNAMGMDLAEDVGISSHRLVRMFESEIIPGLKSGEITAGNSDALTEIQESLNLDPDECETMFENVILRLSKQALDLIQSELLRGREDNTVGVITELVGYAAFVDGDLGLEVDEAIAYQIFNIYEAFDFSGVDEETVEMNKELLQVALGISQ